MITMIDGAKTNLSRLINSADLGKEIVITRGRQPVVRLVPVKKARKKRVPGMFKGEFQLSAAFFESLPPRELAGWE